jgi:hypothetical protein
LLFTFILFGTSLIWQGLLVLNVTTLLFAVTVVLIRPIVFFLSLARTKLDRHSCLMISWFGPRGLSSLLLILIPVFANVPGSEQLFVICCLVVLLSIAVHGSSLMLLRRQHAPAIAISANQTLANGPRLNDETVQSAGIDNDTDRISVQELRRLQSAGAPVSVVDARADTSFGSSAFEAQGALRIPPGQVARRLAELNIPRDRWLVVFCA